MRLKGQLHDKGKLKRTEEVLNQSDSDNPDESRAGMIKKKTKRDPFSARSKTLTTNSLGTVDAPRNRVNGGNIKQSHDTFQSIDTAELGKRSNIWQICLNSNVAGVTLERDYDIMASTPGPPNPKIHPHISRKILGNVKVPEVAASNSDCTLRCAIA